MNVSFSPQASLSLPSEVISKLALVTRLRNLDFSSSRLIWLQLLVRTQPANSTDRLTLAHNWLEGQSATKMLVDYTGLFAL